ncbi:hypothetical protein HBE96_05065 [Clostridium sp. P21]|uniref:Uncharacterized protein n=1 Tax=Clostridium muellerianum TaxID=2716538 RepID=A0A7Y0HLM2_9CLOT|nr:hypothetical protein [Clostridium muellerianum]NMM62069.1 hypothetical protein [Clostridium muellerianum]
MGSTMDNISKNAQYIYGSGRDLSDAIAKYGNNKNYNFVDTSTQGFDPSTMKSDGWMLGGNKVNTNVSDDMLQSKGIHRLGGADATDTQNALANAISNGISTPQSGLKYVYASGTDLQNAQNIFRTGDGYKIVDVSAPDFDPANMQKGGIMLGGNGVNKNITDNMLNRLDINRAYGQDSTGTAKAAENYYWDSQKPTSPTVVSTPTFTPFSFTGNMQNYLDEAQQMLKPQYDLTVKNINDNYDTNLIPQANNDTLSRGLARSSYAGNRVDQVNKARTTDLTNAAMQEQQQINNMALQNYDKAYDRSYQGWKDQNANNWQTYNAQNTANQQGFQNQMNLYNANRGDYWKNKSYDADQTYKQQQQNNWQKQFDTSNDQWQKTFDFNKQNADRQFDLEKEKLTAALSRASSGGSGGRGGGRSYSSGGRRSSSNSYGSEDDQIEAFASDKSIPLYNRLQDLDGYSENYNNDSGSRNDANLWKQALLDGRWYDDV